MSEGGAVRFVLYTKPYNFGYGYLKRYNLAYLFEK